MTLKKKYEAVAEKLLTVMQERPLETIAVLSVAASAVAKIINSATQARNAKTWKQEVRRRDYTTRNRYNR